MMRKSLTTVIVVSTTAIRKVALHWQGRFSIPMTVRSMAAVAAG
jgi:hypothetical protein